MKKKIIDVMLAFVCIISCGVCLTACGNKETWHAPQRVHLSLTDKVHVEYINNAISGDSTLPSYCVLVKEGNQYYIKTPHKYYQSNRLEVFVKTNLTNAVEFAGAEYSQGHISARWDDYANAWISAADDSDTSPNAPEWHANDENGSVYYTGIAFLDSGYDDVNHIYENGVADSNGHKYTATRLEDTILAVGENNVNCVVWEYEEYHSADIWKKAKYWFDAETNIILKQTTVYPSSENQSLDADENVGFKATYFSKTETLQDYLTSIGRWPAPDFSNYR